MRYVVGEAGRFVYIDFGVMMHEVEVESRDTARLASNPTHKAS
jgi:hypothetical protein